MRRLTQAAGLLTFLPALAHELTHYALASLGTDDAEIRFEIAGSYAVTSWPPLDSSALRFVASLGPTLIGSLVAVAWLASGLSLGKWDLLAVVGLVVYTLPSPSDIVGAVPMTATAGPRTDDAAAVRIDEVQQDEV